MMSNQEETIEIEQQRTTVMIVRQKNKCPPIKIFKMVKSEEKGFIQWLGYLKIKPQKKKKIKYR